MIERYQSKKLSGVFSDRSRYEAYLEVELAADEAWNKLGAIPDGDLAKIEANAKVDVARIAELEEVTKHDVVAFTRQIGEGLGPEKKWIHYGLTSTDVVDTALGCLYLRADDAVAEDYRLVIAAVKDKAMRYEKTPCIGRTHGMQAEITSFGLKWANYYDELNRDLLRFDEARRLVECGKLSGALGNYANVDPYVQEYVCAKLHLESAPISTQILSRDRHAYYGSTLAIAASTLEKIATEIRNLSRSEIGEVEEGFGKGQKGSSAMPQKRNPIGSENICGCARLMRGYLVPLLEDNALYHERDISHSSVERVAFIDMIELFAYMLERTASLIENLSVFPLNMEKNLALSHGAIYAQRVLTSLVDQGLSREKAYDLIQPLAMGALQGEGDFLARLLKEKKVVSLLGETGLRKLFEDGYYLRHVEDIYRRVGLIS